MPPSKPASLRYWAALVSALVITILLPLFYAAIVALVCYSLYRFTALFVAAGHHHVQFGYSIPYRTRYHLRHGSIIPIILSVGLILVHVVALISLIRPLFVRRPQRTFAMPLSQKTQPALWLLVSQICERLGAPLPRQIEMDCECDASVEFREGMLLPLRSEITLRIGLPLAAGLTLRQFAGVLAHEIGHTRRGFGLGVACVIRRINGWFFEMNDERNGWRRWLEGFRDGPAGLGTFLADCAIFIMAGVQVVVQLPLSISCIVNNFLLRQMELQADDCEIELAGSREFAATTVRLATLGEAVRLANREARASWNFGRRLPENFAECVLSNETKIPEWKRQELEQAGAASKTRLWDSHPSDADRLARVPPDLPGYFTEDGPATSVFAHFDAMAREVTYLDYVNNWGLTVESVNLRPWKESVS